METRGLLSYNFPGADWRTVNNQQHKKKFNMYVSFWGWDA